MIAFQAVIYCAFIFAGSYILPYFFPSLGEEQYHAFIQVLGFYAFFLNLNDLLFYFFRNKGDLKNFVKLNVTSLVLMTVGSILGIVVLKKGIEGAIYGRTIGYCLTVIIFTLIYIKWKPLNFKLIKELLKSGLPLYLSTIAGAYLFSMDKLFIQHNLSLTVLGIYSIALTIIYVIDILTTGFQHFLLPEILSKVNHGVESPVIEKEVKQSFYIFLLLSLSFVAIVPYAIHIFPENFHTALSYLPLMVLLPITRFISGIFSVNLYLKEKSGTFLKLQVLNAICTFVFFLILPARFGIISAIFLALFYNLVNLAFTIYFSKGDKVFLMKDKKFYLILSFSILSCVVLYFLYSFIPRAEFFIIPAIVTNFSILILERPLVKRVLYKFVNI